MVGRNVNGLPRFSWEEGEGLALLKALLGKGRGDVVENPIAARVFAHELVRTGARGIARDCVRWMLEGGGWRERHVLRDGRRARVRPWDREYAQGFGLRFTAASRELWIEGARWLPALVGRAEGDPDRRTRKALAKMFEGAVTDTGDWVFFAVAIASVESFRLCPSDLGTLRGRLRAGSPLAGLMFPVLPLPGAAETPGELVERLFLPANARLLECSEDRLAGRWARAANDAARARETPAELQRRWDALSLALRRYLSAADSALRLDLARPVAKALRATLETTFVAGGEALRQSVAGTAGLRSIAERDALLASVAGFVGLGQWLLRRREEMAQERYGDDRYEESQIFLRDVDELLGPLRGRVEGINRALSGTLG